MYPGIWMDIKKGKGSLKFRMPSYFSGATHSNSTDACANLQTTLNITSEGFPYAFLRFQRRSNVENSAGDRMEIWQSLSEKFL